MIASKEAPRKPGDGLPWPESILAVWRLVKGFGYSLEGFAGAVENRSCGLAGRTIVRRWITNRPTTISNKSRLACRMAFGFTAAELPPEAVGLNQGVPRGYPSEGDFTMQAFLTEASIAFYRKGDVTPVSREILYSARVDAGRDVFSENARDAQTMWNDGDCT